MGTKDLVVELLRDRIDSVADDARETRANVAEITRDLSDIKETLARLEGKLSHTKPPARSKPIVLTLGSGVVGAVLTFIGQHFFH